MPRYDFHCEACDRKEERFCVVAARNEQDCACGHRMTKLITLAAAVHDDTIIGGFWQENFGPTPEYFESKREMARRAKEVGAIPFVRHIGENGTDKSSKTSRWI